MKMNPIEIKIKTKVVDQVIIIYIQVIMFAIVEIINAVLQLIMSVLYMNKC